MKKKDIQELKNQSVENLHRLIKESNEKLRRMHFDLAAGKVKDISQIHELKRNVARMKTLITQHEAPNK